MSISYTYKNTNRQAGEAEEQGSEHLPMLDHLFLSEMFYQF